VAQTSRWVADSGVHRYWPGMIDGCGGSPEHTPSTSPHGSEISGAQGEVQFPGMPGYCRWPSGSRWSTHVVVGAAGTWAGRDLDD